MIFFVIPGIIILLVCYFALYRPWQLRWGATDADVAAQQPGDDIVKSPAFNATRAITIQALPEDIWPWIVQIGNKRAGWYSYDWFDNLGKPSAKEILPQYQRPQRGDLIPMSPNGKIGVWIKDFAVNEWMLWWNPDETVTWLWSLEPKNNGQTRLITRVRMRYTWFSPIIVFNIFIDIGDIIMMRKCMLGVRERAEHLRRANNAT